MTRGIVVTEGERTWLRSRGDRRAEDVMEDAEGRKYVLMGDGERGLKKVYIPEWVANGWL